MLPPESPIHYVRFSTGLTRRNFAKKASAAAALVAVGCTVVPTVVDEHDALLPAEKAPDLSEQIRNDIHELVHGRLAHARKTIDAIELSRKTHIQEVDILLGKLYSDYAKRIGSRVALDTFLDTFDTWLTPEGVAKVDLLFDRADLDRAPESLGILLLATTRLTKDHFTQRHAFITRLERWLIGRNGRTAKDVENMLQGLRA